MTRRIRLFAAVNLAICATVLLAGAWFARAGDLNPPPGAVAPTMKTLAQIEPRIAVNAANTPGDADSLFRISQPGSYYLTGDITGEVGKHGVEIAASGVTLDLNGFDLAGVPAMGSFDGVSTTVANLTNIAVVNGSVRNWGGDGVDMETAVAFNCRVDGVFASGNTLIGIRTGIASSVTHCSAYQNTGNGIDTGYGSTVSNCAAVENGGSGISIDVESTVADCLADGNNINGIRCVANSVIRDNNCQLNGRFGDGAGIRATSNDNRIEGNNCTRADRGLQVDANGNIIIRNTCAGNTVDWVIAANNVFGPIIDRRAPGSAAVSGFTAASSLGSTDANANFSY